MKNKIISLVLVLNFILLVASPVSVSAAEPITYSVSASTTEPTIGNEFDVMISLTNYEKISDEIRGLQIDVTNIDPNIIEVVSHSTMISDDAVASNKTSYQSAKNLVRLVYLKISGSMDKSVTDVMTFRLKIKDNLTESGSITFPITLKIGTMTENITLNDSLTINYSKKSDDVVKIDVAWGSMEFVYDDGSWDTDNHKWVNGGWKPMSADSNLITVKNSGNVDVKAQLSYLPSTEYADLSGTFIDAASNGLTSPFDLKINNEKKFWLKLSGTTAERWSDKFITVGTVTLTIME